MREQINNYIRSYRSSLKNKLIRARTHEPMVISDTLFGVFDKVSLDTIGKLSKIPNENRQILTTQDNFSEYCIVVPIPDVKTTIIAHVVATHLFSQYSAQKCILSDGGGGFVSKIMRKMEKLFNVIQLIVFNRLYQTLRGRL